MIANHVPLEPAEDPVRAFSDHISIRTYVQPAGMHNVRVHGGFARDFATADGQRVMVAAPSDRQFADLARTTGLGGTFAFLERLLNADFTSCGDLYIHRAAIATLLAPWFARRTVADLAATFAGTSVPWTLLHDLTSHQESRR